MKEILELVDALHGDHTNIWNISRKFFSNQGFSGIACGAVQQSSGVIAGMFIDMPSNWRDTYANNNYIEIDPWAEKAMAAQSSFVYSFEQRDSHFPNKSEPVENMLCDMRENGFSNSVLMPTFKSGDFLSALNLWSDLPEPEFYSYLKHRQSTLAVASAITRAFLKETVESAILSQNYPNWTRNRKFSNPLTAREREVLEWLASGFQSAEIAHRMNISTPTVNFHFKNIRQKLGAKTREQSLALAIVNKFINP